MSPAMEADKIRDMCPMEAFDVGENENIWVFGYGSLMWNPEFEFVQSVPGHICGYHRRFCLLSEDYRGTPDQPGLVLGLDMGGSCRGVLFEVAADKVRQTLADLWEREQTPPGVYKARRVPVLLNADLEQKVEACVFVINRQHKDYYPDTCRDKAADLIHRAHGVRGSNLEYLANTVYHLQSLNIQDRQLEDLLTRVEHRLAET